MKAKKTKRSEPIETPRPRDAGAIQGEFNAACAHLGEVTYRIALFEARQAQLVSILTALENESKERKRIDAEYSKGMKNGKA